ncbi:MAG: radical SAM family heme chaperone HemW [Planctomycetaceae bacterium]
MNADVEHQSRKPRSAYIHVPFCLHRCGYCDFTLVANRDHLIPQYLQSLETELSQLDGGVEVDTLFVGGGTPTHLSSDQLKQLFTLLQRYVRLASGGEFSVEANPDGLDQGRMQTLAEFGVNRISLGVQSFDDQCLKLLERQHRQDDAISAVQLASRYVSNVSLDLIFGVPGQTEDSWQKTLRIATSLPVHHVSTYGLTWEKGTSFHRRLSNGQLCRVAEETERNQYLFAIAHLSSSGFRHYEVSNFARPQFECHHNLVYWKGNGYYAFGPGAARYINGRRSTNIRSVPKWMRAVNAGEAFLEESECLTPEEKAREAIMLGLRLRDGIELEEFQRRYERSVQEIEPIALQRYLDTGLLEQINGRLRLTVDGLLLADTVTSDFL